MSDNLCDWMPCVFCTLLFHGKYWRQWMSSRSMWGNELVLWEDFLLGLILNLIRKQYVLSESCQLLYLYIYYIYIGIVLFVYCFIACLQHWGITFFISIFYFCSLLRPLFSPHVGTTQTDILYSVTGKRQPLISDSFLISKQINDAETRPLSLPPPLVAH